MRLIGYLENGVRHIGALDGDKVAPLGTAAAFYSDTAAALAAEPAGPSLNLADLEQAPAVPETARVFILGINSSRRASRATWPGSAPQRSRIRPSHQADQVA